MGDDETNKKLVVSSPFDEETHPSYQSNLGTEIEGVANGWHTFATMTRPRVGLDIATMCMPSYAPGVAMYAMCQGFGLHAERLVAFCIRRLPTIMADAMQTDQRHEYERLLTSSMHSMNQMMKMDERRPSRKSGVALTMVLLFRLNETSMLCVARFGTGCCIRVRGRSATVIAKTAAQPLGFRRRTRRESKPSIYVDVTQSADMILITNQTVCTTFNPTQMAIIASSCRDRGLMSICVAFGVHSATPDEPFAAIVLAIKS
jgi:hypothetical protein